MPKATEAGSGELVTWSQTSTPNVHSYLDESNDQRTEILMGGRDVATERSGPKRAQLSKSMPKLPNHFLPGMTAEDDDVLSRRSSLIFTLNHSDTVAVPPPAKFCPGSKSAVGILPRSKSENDFDARTKTFPRAMYHRRAYGGLSDKADSCNSVSGLSHDGFHGGLASVFSVWESLMTNSMTDELGDPPAP